MAQLKSMGLIILALLVLVVPGIIYNNLANNGLAVSPTQSLVCDGIALPTCQISGNAGCQASASYCTLSGSTISFLSITSPFTQLIQGNIFGLFSNLNGQGYQGPGAQSSLGGSHGPFDVAQGGTFYTVNCFGNPGADKSQTHWTMYYCTQTYSDNKNMTTQQATNWTDWSTQQSGVTAQIPFVATVFANSTFSYGCSYIGQINYTAIANGPGFTYYGCSVWKPNHALVITDAQWAYLVAIPVSNGPMAAGFSHIFVYAQLENWAVRQCVGTNLGAWSSVQCDQFRSAFTGVNIPGTSVTFVPGVGSALLGVLAGVALFILGTGLGFGFGGGVETTVNAQGTRLAQTMGLGLICWSVLYSEFATWFTSGLLPYGFDGSTGIMSIVLNGFFFFGVFWRAMSRD